MGIRARNLLLFLVLAGVAATSWLLRPTADTTVQDGTAAAVQRGYYLRDARFSGFDETGRIVYTVAAGRIEGSDEHDNLELSDVRIQYAESADVPWSISAAAAHSADNNDLLELRDVTMQTTRETEQRSATIEAQALQLSATQRTAEAAGPVRFTIGNSTITAVGLSADLRADKFTLESEVNGRVSR